jgi:hypothetical protein
MEIQPHQYVTSALRRPYRPFGQRKALTLHNPPSIRAAMAAGVIPPPLFFERSLPCERIGSGNRDLGDAH